MHVTNTAPCICQDGVPRGAYRGTVQVSLRGGEVRLYIAPAPGFRWKKPEGQTVVDRTGAVKKVRQRVHGHPASELRSCHILQPKAHAVLLAGPLVLTIADGR